MPREFVRSRRYSITEPPRTIRDARELRATRAYSGIGTMKNALLEEVWRVREKLAVRFDCDLHGRVVRLPEQQTRHGARPVRTP